MNKHRITKVVVCGMILLVVGIGIIPMTVRGDTYLNARVYGEISGSLDHDVTWVFAFPSFSQFKIFVIGLNLDYTNGSGYISIAPRGQPSIKYYYPEDFHTMSIAFFSSPFGYVYADSNLFHCQGHAYIINID